jgi:hypothetical protein
MHQKASLLLLAAAFLCSSVVCLHATALAALESHLAPVDLPRDVFVFRSLSNSSRVCVSRSCGSISFPASFSVVDGMFAALHDISQRQIVAYLDFDQRCFAEPNAARCIAFLESTAPDCFFDPGQAVSYNFTAASLSDESAGEQWSSSSHTSSFWAFVEDWTMLRAQLRLLFAGTGNFSVECSATLRVITSVAFNERENALLLVSDHIRSALLSAASTLRQKWRLLNSTLALSSATDCSEAQQLAAALSGGSSPAGGSLQWLADVQQPVVNATLRLLSQYAQGSGDDAALMMPCYCLALAHGLALAATEDFSILRHSDPSLLATDSVEALSSLCDAGVVASRVASLNQVISSRVGTLLQPQPATATRACVFAWFSSSSPQLNASVTDCFARTTPASVSDVFGADFSQFLSVPDSSQSPVDLDSSSSFRLWSLQMSWRSFDRPSSELLTLFLAAPRQSTSITDFSLNRSVILTSWAELITPATQGDSFPAPQTIPASVNGTCPIGYYYRIDDERGLELCTECLSLSPDFVYCPGDQRVHLCANKPLSYATYVSQGLRPADPDCPFLCSLPFQFRAGNSCTSAPMGYYPSAASEIAPCERDLALAASPLSDQLVFLSSGLFGRPRSCSRGLRRRSLSTQIEVQSLSSMSQLLLWCPSATARGVTWTISVSLNVSLVQLIAADQQQLAGSGVAMEIVSLVGADGWAIFLSVRAANSSIKSQRSLLFGRLFLNSSAFLGAHFSPEFEISSSSSANTNTVVSMRIAVSIDAAAGLLIFFLNDALLGAPRLAADLRNTDAPCHGGRLAFGGRRAFFNFQPTGVYTGSEKAALPMNFTPFAGVISSFFMSSHPLPLLSLPVAASAAVPATVSPTTLASVLFSPVPTNSRLLALVAAHSVLFQNPLEYPWINASEPPRCRWGTRSVAGSCRQCPAGSISTERDGCQSCLPSRHLAPTACDMQRSTECMCDFNRAPYPPPQCVALAPIPILIEGAFPVPVVSCKVDESSVPGDAGTPASASAIFFWWSCPGNLSTFAYGVQEGSDQAVLTVTASVAYGLDTCEVFAQVREDGREPGARFSTSLQIFPRAPPIALELVNVPNGSTLALELDSLHIAVANYSFFAPSAVALLAALATAGKAINAFAKVQSAVRSARIAASLPNGSTYTFTANGTLDLPINRAAQSQPTVVALYVFSPMGMFATSRSSQLVVFPFQPQQLELSPAAAALTHPGMVATLSVCLVSLAGVAVLLRWRQLHPSVPVAQSPTTPGQRRSTRRTGRRTHHRREARADDVNDATRDTASLHAASPAKDQSQKGSRQSASPLGRPPISCGVAASSPLRSSADPVVRDWERSVSPRPRSWKQQPELPPAAASRSERNRRSPSHRTG